MSLRKRVTGSLTAVLLAAAMTVSCLDGLTLNVKAADTETVVSVDESADSSADVDETEVDGENTETEETAEDAATEAEEECSEKTADAAVEAEDSEYTFDLIGADENEQDILNVAFHDVEMKEAYLLLAKVADEEDEETYSYKVLNPAEDYSDYENLLVYYFDKDGEGRCFTKTDVEPISWYVWDTDDTTGEEKAELTADLYYMVDGAIVLSDQATEITLQKDDTEKTYSVEANGKATELEKEAAVETSAVTAGYVVEDGYLRYVDKTGKSTIYIKSKTKTGTYAKKVSGKYYKVAYKTGKAAIIDGVYSGVFYINGVKYTGTARWYVSGGYVYKVSATGAAKKYISTTTKTQYKMVAYKKNGRRYIYTITKSTAAAVLYKKDTSKSGTYPFVYRSQAFRIEYATGLAAGLYTGFCGGKLYKSGKLNTVTGVYDGYYVASGVIKTAAAQWYAIYDGYIYLVEKDGSAAVYIREADGDDTTYTYSTGSYIYTIQYTTGKVASKTKIQDSDKRKKLIAMAENYLGYYEKTTGTMSHRKIVDIYNNYTPRARNYKVTYTDAWCATYVSAMFIKLGWTKIFPLECSCYYQVAGWKTKGRWKEDESYTPQKGDIIYYNWSDSGSGDCKGTPNHVGIVESVSSSNVITVIEGNKTISTAKGDGVAKRKIKVNGRYIRGYGLPNYAALD